MKNANKSQHPNTQIYNNAAKNHTKTQYKIIELLEEKRIYKNKKNNYSKNKLKELEHIIYMNENRAPCRNLNRSHKDVKSRIPLCIDANGENLNRKN